MSPMKTMLIPALVFAIGAGLPFHVSAAPKVEAPPSGSFQVSEAMNKAYSLIEMRDGTGKWWPMFWLAHPRGTGSIDTAKGTGSFTIVGEGRDVQLFSGSRQEKRIAGKLATEESYKDKDGVDRKRHVGPAIELKVQVTGPGSASVTILFNGKTITTQGTYSVRAAGPTGQGSIDISGTCETTLRTLGLENEDTPVKIAFFAPGRP